MVKRAKKMMKKGHRDNSDAGAGDVGDEGEDATVSDLESGPMSTSLLTT